MEGHESLMLDGVIMEKVQGENLSGWLGSKCNLVFEVTPIGARECNLVFVLSDLVGLW